MLVVITLVSLALASLAMAGGAWLALAGTIAAASADVLVPDNPPAALFRLLSAGLAALGFALFVAGAFASVTLLA